MSILVSRLLRDRDLFERYVMVPFCAAGCASIVLLIATGVLR